MNLRLKSVFLAVIICLIAIMLVSCGGGDDNTTTTEAPHTHSYVEHAAVEATCTDGGNEKYYTCEGCSLIFDANKATITAIPTVNATGHSYVEHAAVEATCTSDGNDKYYTCEDCELIFDGNKATITAVPTISATGHSYVEHVAVEATCTTNGNDKYYTCEDCELIFDGNKATITAIPTVNATGHSYVEHAAVEATCTTNGNEKYYTCEDCELIFDANKATITVVPTITATGHTYVEHGAVLATCIADGNEKYYTCEDCSLIFNAEKATITAIPTVTATGHSYVEHVAVEATCTEDGNDKYYTCEDCELIFDASKATITAVPTISATGHDYVEHVEVEATCTEGGNEKYYTCEDCSLIFNAEKATITAIPTVNATGHSYVEHVAVEAMCTEDGNEKYYTCEDCELIFDASKETIASIPTVTATGHSYVENVAVEATCTEDGNEKYYTCKDCTLIFNGNKEEISSIPIIESTGHAYTSTKKDLSEDITYKLDICNACGAFVIDVNDGQILTSDYNKYNSVNMYTSFKGLEKEDALTNAYFDALTGCFVFQFGDVTLEDDTVFIIDCNAYGLTMDEAFAVWSAIESDYPMFYWLENTVSFSDGYVFYETNSDYYTPEQRRAYNELIFDAIDEIVSENQGKTDFQITKAIYDMIIDATDYAYDGSGSPSSELKAHSILGYFEGQNVVCEGYAKTLQILLNVFEIENCYVTGYAGEDHAWNYVNLYGEWFLIDATWGDTSGSRYDYFLVSDFENGAADHVANDQTLGIKYHYELPKLSKGTFALSTLYKNGEFLSYHATIDGAIGAMNDESADYIIYLYDTINNETYFKVQSGFYKPYGYVYVTSGVIDGAKSLVVIGWTEQISSSRTPYIFFPNNVEINTDITLKNVQFKLLNGGSKFIGQDTTLNILNHKLIFEGCVGQFVAKVQGIENSEIVFGGIIGFSSADVTTMYGKLKVDSITINESDIDFYCDVDVQNLYLYGNARFSNLNKQIIVDAGMDNDSTDVKIGTVYISESSSLYFEAPMQYKINAEISTIITEGDYPSLVISFFHMDYYPNITIKNKVEGKIIVRVMGIYETMTERLTVNPLLYDGVFFNYKWFNDSDMEIYSTADTIGYEVTDYFKMMENGDIVADVTVNGDFIIRGTTLVSYAGNDLIVTIPEGITHIALFAILEKDALVVVLPSTLEEIDVGFVAYCKKLTEIVNKSNVPAGNILASNGFDGISIKKVSNEQSSFVVDGFWFIEVEGEYYLFYYNGDETEIVLPSGDDLDVLNGNKYGITSEAFARNNNIISVEISGSVKFIDYGAFLGCEQLTTVIIEDGVKEIGEFAFASCKGIQEIEIPDSITKIGDLAFNMCINLKKVTLSSTCTCGEGVFLYCMSMSDVYYYGTEEQFNEKIGANSGIDTSLVNLYVYVDGNWVKAN